LPAAVDWARHDHGHLMVIMEGTYLRTGKVIYHQMTRFWSRVLAVNFAMGVATGIVMEFQFGTNWAVFSRDVGRLRRGTAAGRPRDIRQHLPDDDVADEPGRDDRLAAAAAALAGRAGAQLVRAAGRPRPPDRLPPALLLPRLGRRVDRPRRHDPAALRHRADLAGRHAGRGRGDRVHPGEPVGARGQGLRTDRAEVA